MKKEIAVVYEEDDYSLFKKLVGNRNVTESRKNTIKASMAEKEIINPILVNERMEIIEGQGRFEALRELGRPIKYIVVEGAELSDCQRLNKANKNWTTVDIVKSYAAGGYSDYSSLLTACELTKLEIRAVLRLLGRAVGALNESLARGNLRFGKADIAEACNMANRVEEISNALQLKGRSRSQVFLGAMRVIMTTEGYEHPTMIKNCEMNRMSYVPMSRLEDELKQFENIYNYRARENKRLYFSDYMRNKGASVRDYTKTNYHNDSDVSTLQLSAGA